MDKKTVVTRMAPSPTGEYHIGHIRTVLYNWAWARKNNGKFIIRIEDTDRTRFVEGATERILKDIKDYGFDWDEGPYFQSERLKIYEEYGKKLVESGHAYYCFCTQERLAQMREEQKAKKLPTTKYDRLCCSLTPDQVSENLSKGIPKVLRLKVPDNEQISFDDQVFGTIKFNSNDIDDQVLIKSDGFPTYHFAVVVDDHLMGVTHIMRGNDWLPSTPKHVLLYKAFGWEMPIHAHLPNLKELGGSKKLSKRFGAVFARDFLEDGYLPEALANFLMFLGWNPGGEKEIYSIDEFIQSFDIKKIHKTDLVAFDRNKLMWINGQYIQKLDDGEFVKRLSSFTKLDISAELMLQIVPLVKPRIKKLTEFDGMVEFFVKRVVPQSSELSVNHKVHFDKARNVLDGVIDWNVEAIGEAFSKIVADNSFSPKEFFMDMRLAISGKKVSPPLNESMAIIGKSDSIKRIVELI